MASSSVIAGASRTSASAASPSPPGATGEADSARRQARPPASAPRAGLGQPDPRTLRAARSPCRPVGGRHRQRGAQSSRMPRLVFWPHGGPRRLDAAPDALADARSRCRDRRCRRHGAAAEILDRHAVAGRVVVHVAGLEGRELGRAGGDGSRGAMARSRAQPLPRQPAARWPAMSVSLTLCSPCQAGMALISSSVSRPSRSSIRSTPAMVAADGRGRRDGEPGELARRPARARRGRPGGGW